MKTLNASQMLARANGFKFVMGLGCALIAGCGNLSGLDSKDSFACKAPDGVLCASMTGIYSNAQQSNLPGQQFQKSADPQPSETTGSTRPGSVMTQALQTGAPIRSAPRILRVWFAPWEDNDGDLHDQSYVYLGVDAGKWQIEHTRRRITDAYRPVRALVVAPKAAPDLGENQITEPEPPNELSSGPHFSNPLKPLVLESLESLRARRGGDTTSLD